MKRQIFQKKKLQKRFEDKGFVKVKFLDENQIEKLQKLYNELSARHLTLGFHSTMMNEDPTYRERVDEDIKKVVHNSLDICLNDYEILFANFIVKEPGKKGTVGVHQDWTYVDEAKCTAVNFWCPLIRADENNGTLRILPGSHKLKTPIRRTPWGGSPFDPFIDLIRENAEVIPCDPGDAIVYHPALAHFSELNMSDEPRVVIGFVAVPQEAEPRHYYYDQQKPEQLEVFRTDPSFYRFLDQDSRPQKGESLGWVDYDQTYFTAKELNQMIGKNKKKGSVASFLSQLFS